MSKSVIKVDQLSKRYRLGLKEKQSDTLLGQISQAIQSPWKNLKQLRALNRFGQEDDSVFWALKDISFEVKGGEVLGIIGKNGAGKSTLLKILSQITEPTSGKIEIHGRVASLLEVGTGFHPELSGRENIYMNGTILGMTRREIDSKLDEIIDFSGVEKFIDTPVKFYSSGMKVRLGFSVAAHLDPEILIIDEVLAVGDYEFQKKCLGKMEDVSKNQGRTVLFVSHQMDAIKNLCQKGLILKNGTIVSSGLIEKVISEYLDSDIVNKKLQANGNDTFISKIDLDLELLKSGVFEINFEFFSNKPIQNPIFGFVVYNQLGSPVFGSNPRFHTINYLSIKNKEGKFKARLEDLRIHSGVYKISVWFSNGSIDLEKIDNAITFEFISLSVYNDLPNPLYIGAYNPAVIWEINKTIE
ncbi:ABC transporter ATP-binding protein [Mongoliitalea lutea]|uniref:ABC transporter ATP-binding protein n=1 Tax=Mongoliitalea lutea TaxID=849756 RepID=A0A8J3G3N5_9BACT|nr:ABC transporter ATP-binding protein [Mongoliitalea lutea]GHB23845.1 ABC transporter ATP-binding protein [Mongoliitalea lutea]